MVNFPLGHKIRRTDGGIDRIGEKFRENIAIGLTHHQQAFLLPLFDDRATLEKMAVDTFMDTLAG